MWRKVTISGVAFFWLVVATASAILNGFETTKDLTEDPNFNCKWSGGTDSRLECSCLTGNEEFYIKKNSIPATDLYAINITNCGKIRFGPNAISDMRNLRILELNGIGSLFFEEESLLWTGYTRNKEKIEDWDSTIPSLKIYVVGGTIKKISSHAIKGRINRIRFQHVEIDEIAPFGFSSLEQNQEIQFDHVNVRELLPQSFKKFPTEKLVITNSVFGEIPSRAFYDVLVKHEFLLKNVTIETLKPSGFIIVNPHIFELRDSTIVNFNGEGFKVTTRGNVHVRNNEFFNVGMGAFRNINLNREEVPGLQLFVLESNTFHKLSRDALVINETSFIPKFSGLRLQENCDCNNEDKYMKSTHELNCLVDNEWISFNDYKNMHCSVLTSKVGVTIIVVIVCSCLLVIGIIGFVCYFRRLYRCGSYGKEGAEKQGKMSMIVPDGRTYRETELHVIVERADLLTTDL
ncbi:PREDICTED: uncharacterized protein LOC108569693 [Nicrophorus vespilloides]|uniref:Uncharacterized protein LOC108569693 n=1 Tax=Nicrophorus vespilloides TaxID=110193 RepID=A0ABM1NJ29_NICVS|nr:PREDICTED: uncharacterized protein LOC108569693 [Nicrophorus vespilloides]XP_017786830.1 PREDICTED: uncharacterized protein LOC108569693 [Nicrophorus vespilloides]XP_017786831.1 PREDICTED: uncharacterized protein LOC108569693 [Nicrophorus vespilloides]